MLIARGIEMKSAKLHLMNANVTKGNNEQYGHIKEFTFQVALDGSIPHHHKREPHIVAQSR